MSEGSSLGPTRYLKVWAQVIPLLRVAGRRMGSSRGLLPSRKELVSAEPQKLQQAYIFLMSHEGSRYLEELSGRRERAEMAMRLVRWLGQSHAAPSSLGDAVSILRRKVLGWIGPVIN